MSKNIYYFDILTAPVDALDRYCEPAENRRQYPAAWTTAKIHAIRQLMQNTADHVRQKAPAVYSRELVELIFVQPCCRTGNLVDADIAQRQTASVYLKALCDAGVLKEVKAGHDRLFINPRLMTLLTAERDRLSLPAKARKATDSPAAAKTRQ